MIECEDKSLQLYKNSLKELVNYLKNINYYPHALTEGELKPFDINFKNKAENLFFLPKF